MLSKPYFKPPQSEKFNIKDACLKAWLISKGAMVYQEDDSFKWQLRNLLWGNRLSNIVSNPENIRKNSK